MDAESVSQMTLSFAGCGFLCIYHAGVCAAIKEYAPQLQRNKMAGASAGAIAAVGLMCNVCLSEATSTILKVVTQARSRTLGALHPAFNLIDLVRSSLDYTLPENAHEICSGRLQISLTRERDRENVVVSDFSSKAELIQAILCSCFIPYYCGRSAPYYRGEQYFDGGWSDNQPIVDGDSKKNAITVSPFAGESDICPPDSDSASFFGFPFAGTSIRFTAKNLYRLTVCLIPPSTDICSKICRQGFEDGLRFLTKNGLVSCARCLTVQSNVVSVPVQHSLTSRNRNRSQNFLSTVNHRRQEGDNETCAENNNCTKQTEPTSLFPALMQKILDDAGETENTVVGYLFSFRLVRWIRNSTLPFTLPFEVLLLMCKNIAKWIRSADTTVWFTERLQLVVDFVLKEIENQRAMYSARLTCQLAITEVDVTGLSASLNHREQLLKIKLSPEAQKELSTLKKRDSAVFNRANATRSQTPEEVTIGTSTEASSSTADNRSSLNEVVDYAKEHDAVLAYFYEDDNKKIRVCEIFDVENPEKRHRCHSHLSPPDDEETITESLSTEALDSADAETWDVDAENGNVSLPECFVDESTDIDSGLSTAEEAAARTAFYNTRDACCSPVHHLSYTLPLRSSLRAQRAAAANARRHTFSASCSKKPSFSPLGGMLSHSRNAPDRSRVCSSDSDGDSSEHYFVPGRRSRNNSEEYDGEPEQSDTDQGV